MNAGTDGDAGSNSWTPSFLVDLREQRRHRVVALVVAALVGVGFAWLHWFGLFVAGALVGLASRTLLRAVIAAVAVGAIVLLVQILAGPGMGVADFLAVSPPSYVAIAAAVGAPVWGSLVRGVV